MIEELIAQWQAATEHATKLHAAYVAALSEDAEWRGSIDGPTHWAREAWAKADADKRQVASRLADELCGRVYVLSDGQFLLACDDDYVEIRRKYE